jgi:hypothetical protein
MICTTQYHTAAIMQEQYSGTIPQAAGNFGRRMLPCALEDPETSKQDTDLPRLKNSLNRNPIESPSSLSFVFKGMRSAFPPNLAERSGPPPPLSISPSAAEIQKKNPQCKIRKGSRGGSKAITWGLSIKMPRMRHGWHVC